MDWIPAKLRTIRQEFNMTQLEIAQASGLSQRDISQLENGRKEGLPKEFIHFLHTRGVDLNWLFADPAAETAPATSASAGAPAKYSVPESSTSMAAEDRAGYGRVPGGSPVADGPAELRLVAQEQLRQYAQRCQEPAFEQQLPVGNLPLPEMGQGVFRAFQLPDAALAPAFAALDWVIARKEAPGATPENGALYVVVTRQQVWVQQVVTSPQQPGVLTLRPTANGATTTTVPQVAVTELWRVTGRLSFQVSASPPPTSALEASLQDLLSRVQRLEQGR
ncbi:helix-turn-helix domain-containing protein [Hymenobacter cellulosilyticus]|uniref:Helix-turn-helix domain-containing protein n=1 Tax=Hymenobacter cellulosilyticus TaxID=2932248 RepID=A0A8T9Q793_9BACT|nr:helix-turn-helix transcriptional regulator [Hymenobacter cellulosilyticus]UOQ73456.1 helix-turn-helix domain-containing protein [Hymenobacter cellulosilyticus]